MPAVAEPPAKPAAPNVGSVAPSSAGVIHVTQSGMSAVPTAPASPEPRTEPKPQPKPTAREQMTDRLAQKIKPGTGVDTTPEKPLGEVVKPDPEPPKETPAEGDEPEAAATAEPQEPGEVTGKRKVNPWKLVDEHKTARAKVEQELVDLKKLVPNEAVRKQELAELEQARQELKEYQDEIRYVNYAKSPEFKEKYQKPYEQAWAKAMAELKEIPAQDVNGDQRPTTPNDMLELVNAPLGKARELAETMFGNFANDVMGHRKEIKNLFEAQAKALEDARAQGEEREKKMSESSRAQTEALHAQIADHWDKAKTAAFDDENIGTFLKPIEGNQDHNHRLAKATELVERAFKENPLTPGLTPEERVSIVKRHAAVRNRSIAYGPMLNEIKTQRTRITELEAKLKEYEASTPGTVPSQPAANGGAPLGARAAMEQRLGKLVKTI